MRKADVLGNPTLLKIWEAKQARRKARRESKKAEPVPRGQESASVNTLPKWARVYIITGGAEGKLGKVNSLPLWARNQINAIKKVAQHNRQAEKEYREENCKGCSHKGKCSPKRQAVCDDLRDIPPC